MCYRGIILLIQPLVKLMVLIYVIRFAMMIHMAKTKKIQKAQKPAKSVLLIVFLGAIGLEILNIVLAFTFGPTSIDTCHDHSTLPMVSMALSALSFFAFTAAIVIAKEWPYRVLGIAGAILIVLLILPLFSDSGGQIMNFCNWTF